MTLSDLRRAAELLPPGTSLTLPREALLNAFESFENSDKVAVPAVPADEMLTAEQVAEVLHVSVRWAYDHAKEIGGRRLSRRCVRFSARAVAKYMERRAV